MSSRRRLCGSVMFADDIAICSENREQVKESLERWRYALYCKTDPTIIEINLLKQSVQER